MKMLEKLEILIIENFTMMIMLFGISWLVLVVYGMAMQ